MDEESGQAATGVLHVDLNELCRHATGSGPQWGHESEDLDLTLLSWGSGKSIAPHVNNEVDVVTIVLEGEGEITANGRIYPLSAGQALLIPKGVERSIRSAGDAFRYLSIHRRRRGIVLSTSGRPARQREE
jgi:mannose-6-phosphate isomerase-like protein (cupin superfamily)